jgi:hypothetical protein
MKLPHLSRDRHWTALEKNPNQVLPCTLNADKDQQFYLNSSFFRPQEAGEPFFAVG